MKSGIYVIENLCNHKIYIGQSKSIKARIGRHKSELKHNHHRNIYLQREYNKYGAKCFEFRVLEHCEECDLSTREVYWIKHYNCCDYKSGFNLTTGGENTEWTQQARENRSGENNPMYGKKLSSGQKEAIRIANLGSSDKLTPQDVEKIKTDLLNDVTAQQLASQYGVKLTTICKIYRINNWDWVKPELNELLLNHKEQKEKSRVDGIALIKKLWDEGYKVGEIAKNVGCEKSTVSKYIPQNTADKLKDRNEKIVHDFNKGMSKDEIMRKYNIASSVYVSVTSESYKIKCGEERLQAIELRESGKSVTEISKALHRHRTTITEWTKHIISR